MPLERPPYTYRTAPRGKQLDVIERTWHEPYWALLCRPGTGKTKIGIDTAGLLYAAGEIDALIVVAPNGVHRQWIESGLPVHMPDSVPWSGGAYSSGMGSKALDRLTRSLSTRDMALRVLAITYEGLLTKTGYETAYSLANCYRTLIIVDESQRVSNTKGASHRAVLRVASACRYRRISTGTLFRQNPFSAFGQFELLRPGCLGFNSLASFKSMYAEMLPPGHGLVRKVAGDYANRTGRKITPQIQARDEANRPVYKNLRHLRAQLERIASFMTLEDVQGTSPEVVLTTRFVSLTPEQRTLYDQLRDLGFAQVGAGMLTAVLAMSLATRLCQITGGFIPTDDDSDAKPIAGANPKMQALQEITDELGDDEKVIVWCKFRAELEAVASALRSWYGEDSVAEYHGSISNSQKASNKARFIDDERCRYFVGQIKAGGTGLDGLQRVSRYQVFYSNDYSFTDRDQAIARQARTGGSLVVNVIDIMAENSIDADVVRCMQTAQDVHESVLIDRLRLAPVGL